MEKEVQQLVEMVCFGSSHVLSATINLMNVIVRVLGYRGQPLHKLVPLFASTGT
jgi:hypothetical protein